jgi:hypothetical protein
MKALVNCEFGSADSLRFEEVTNPNHGGDSQAILGLDSGYWVFRMRRKVHG